MFNECRIGIEKLRKGKWISIEGPARVAKAAADEPFELAAEVDEALIIWSRHHYVNVIIPRDEAMVPNRAE
jgi:hypothetical protein